MKTLSIILIMCLFYSWFGCYVSKKKTIIEKVELQDVLPKGDKLYLMKKDSTLYFFNAKTYAIINDTLRGKGQMVSNGLKQSPEPIEMAVNDILQAEIVYIEQVGKMPRKTEKTFIIVVATIGVLSCIIAWQMLSTW